MIYFTSDFHLMHKPFIYGPRGYKDTLTMSNDIIKNINDIVKADDELYILGDLVLDDMDTGIILLKQIRCQHIHIIIGNHDTDNKVKRYVEELENVEEFSTLKYWKYKKFRFILSHYPVITSNNDDSKKVNKKVYNLCGHTHTKDKYFHMRQGINSYHVEVDAHDMKPVSIEEIISDIRGFYGYN